MIVMTGRVLLIVTFDGGSSLGVGAPLCAGSSRGTPICPGYGGVLIFTNLRNSSREKPFPTPGQ